MSSSYVETKLTEALTEARGSATAARRLVLGWVARDPKLLYELAQPFLAGIVGHAVDRVIRLNPKLRPPERATLGANALDGLVKALSRNFAETEPAAPATPSETMRAHADAIRQLANAQVRRRALAYDQREVDQLSSARR